MRVVEGQYVRQKQCGILFSRKEGRTLIVLTGIWRSRGMMTVVHSNLDDNREKNRVCTVQYSSLWF